MLAFQKGFFAVKLLKNEYFEKIKFQQFKLGLNLNCELFPETKIREIICSVIGRNYESLLSLVDSNLFTLIGRQNSSSFLLAGGENKSMIYWAICKALLSLNGRYELLKKLISSNTVQGMNIAWKKIAQFNSYGSYLNTLKTEK